MTATAVKLTGRYDVYRYGAREPMAVVDGGDLEYEMATIDGLILVLKDQSGNEIVLNNEEPVPYLEWGDIGYRQEDAYCNRPCGDHPYGCMSCHNKHNYNRTGLWD